LPSWRRPLSCRTCRCGSSLYLDKPGEIDNYVAAFSGIWQASLDEDASRNLILKAAEELSGNG
jgi:hypothetical protein